MPEINYEVIKSGLVNPNKLKTDAYFQRDGETSNIQTIRKSIRATGKFDKSRPVTVNPKWTIIDGGQRVRAAIKENLKRINYEMYKFATPDDEAKYFDLINEPTKGITARDSLYSKYARPGHPNEYATLLYNICNDPTCVLSGGHDLKTYPGHKSSADFIKVENVCYIINNLVLGERSGFSKKRAYQLAQKAIPIFQAENGIKNAITVVNEFIEFYFEGFGWSTQKGDLKFREAFLRGGLELYYEVLRSNPIFKADHKKIGKRLATFKLTDEATKNHKAVISDMLRRHINKRIKKEENLI